MTEQNTSFQENVTTEIVPDAEIQFEKFPPTTTASGIAPPQYMSTEYTNPGYMPDTVGGNQQQTSVAVNDNIGAPQVIVVTQPQEKPRADETPLYFDCAMLSAGLCFIPIGIVATVFAFMAKKRQDAGDLEGEKKFARPAQILTIASCSLGVITYITIIAIYAKYL